MKTLQQKTMRSIRTVYIMKRVFHPMVLKTAVLGVLLWSLGALVWVARVFENSPSDVLAMVKYIFSAYMQTEILVQLLSVSVIYVVVWMVQDMVKMFKNKTHAHA